MLIFYFEIFFVYFIDFQTITQQQQKLTIMNLIPFIYLDLRNSKKY